ncbi:hypothetical protein Cch01nite_19960 [Cellulomonas chitinilytica]|uniref:Uncharacterized protein n=1 Tax=Cellulomonas chitinilytica TaxID=398759 RepID=A0A919P354_9CELL|nr:hypothetical protein [Cellulomonas chitinilytica]GIG21272.1 hypothetical protein Cch01nite_19960 [Cellulomonas chitinilytica]
MDGDFYVTPGGEIRQRGVRVDDGFHVSPDRLRAGARLYDSLSDDISAAERAGLLLDRPSYGARAVISAAYRFARHWSLSLQNASASAQDHAQKLRDNATHYEVMDEYQAERFNGIGDAL